MRRTLILAAMLCVAATKVWATCAPFPALDGASSSTNMGSIVDGGSNCIIKNTITDAAGTALYPAVAAAADATALPTTAIVRSVLMGYNGTTLDLVDTVNTGTVKTDTSSINGTATVTGGVAGSQGVGGLAASGATSAGNPVRVGGIFNTTQPTVTTGQAVDAQMTARGAQIVANGVEAFTVQPGNTANTTPWLVQSVPGTASGCTPYHLSGGSAATTNSTSIKASAGNLCDLTVVNTTSVIYYLKIYDSAAAPTCSSATGIKHVYPIPNGTGAGAGIQRSLPAGESYASGIGFCLTGGGGDTDNTAAATGVFIEASFK